jgi:hypothetical protein
VKPEELEEAYKMGLIKKEDLVNRGVYLGHCRNAEVAVWLESISRFVYLRSKFGYQFSETIVHPADDERFDIFTPSQKLDMNDQEVRDKWASRLPTNQQLDEEEKHHLGFEE